LSFKYVSKPVKRIDALSKVTGKARYADDLKFPGMLYGVVLRAPVPHAKLISIDSRRALRRKGVYAVITHEDIPGEKTVGVVKYDQPVFVFDKMRYIGDGIALVVAEKEEIARRALKDIKIQYEELPGVFDPLEAMDKRAPKVHEDGNIICYHKVRKGNIKEGFEQSDIVIEREYKTQFIEHAYIEPETVIAIPLDDGGILVYGCIQNAFTTQKNLARVLALDMAKVRIIQTPIGGSFGGKDDVMTVMAARAAVAALKTGRPVKLNNTREESMMESYKRHPYLIRYKIGAKKDGTLMAVKVFIVADGGAYASTTQFVTWRSTVQAAGPYRVPNVHVDTYGVYTNNVYTGAMRGFGSPQVNFAIESIIDELAYELHMDPLELRLKNVLKDGDETGTGHKLREGVTIGKLLEEIGRRLNYRREKRKRNEGELKRGIGIACSIRGVSLGAEGLDAAGVEIKIEKDGSVEIEAGLTDMGQGIKTVLAQVVAEELGVPIEKITVLPYDTSRVPDSGPTVASRATFVGGHAARNAALKLRETFISALKEKVGVEKVEYKEGIYRTNRGDFTYFDVVDIAQGLGKNLNEIGYFKAPSIHWDEEKGLGEPYFTYVFGAQGVIVEVDEESGKVYVRKVVAAHELGRAINPNMARSQIYGGVAMALGYGLLEEFEIYSGIPHTLNYEEYLIPTSKDVPLDVEAIIFETPDPLGPYGAKSLGEPTNELLAPAIANAIFDATGKRLRELPLNLEEVTIGRKLRRK